MLKARQGLTRRFLSDKELEYITGIRVKTLRNWRLLGKGPRYRKMGGTAKYEINDVEAWINSCPAGGGGQPTIQKAAYPTPDQPSRREVENA